MEHGTVPTDVHEVDPLKSCLLCVSCALQGKPNPRLPAKAFGVMHTKDLYPKYLQQGCWTRCLACQTNANAVWEPVQTQANPFSVHTAQPLCTVCENRFLNVRLPPGSHACYVCESVMPESHWTANSIKNHIATRKSALVCKQCEDKGFSARSLCQITCCKCARALGHRKFPTNEMKHAIQRNTLDKLCCVDCKDLLHCGGCHAGFKSRYWSYAEKKIIKITGKPFCYVKNAVREVEGRTT